MKISWPENEKQRFSTFWEYDNQPMVPLHIYRTHSEDSSKQFTLSLSLSTTSTLKKEKKIGQKICDFKINVWASR